jgi:hypothetical protein
MKVKIKKFRVVFISNNKNLYVKSGSSRSAEKPLYNYFKGNMILFHYIHLLFISKQFSPDLFSRDSVISW